MGHRANFVIIKNGNATAYYDQWAALGCTYNFMDGPVAACEAAGFSSETDELQDWAFAEAGYLVDFDQKRAILFGYPEPIEDEDFMEPDMVEVMDQANAALEAGPREFIEQVAPAWAGWTIIWDDRGVDAFAAHLKARKITAIKTQPTSHPEDVEPPIEVKVPE